MDISETYIKMCDCEEMQQDTAYLLDGSDFRTPSGTWLPRQDQLQEMAFSNTSGTDHKMIRELNVFYDYWDENGIPTIFFSWEQLWLAFVMKERYDKTWNGKEWSDVSLCTTRFN